MNETRFTLDDLNQMVATGVDMQDVIKILLALKDMEALIPETDYYQFAVEIQNEHGRAQYQGHSETPVWLGSFEEADAEYSRYKEIGKNVRIIRQRKSAVEVVSYAEMVLLRFCGAG